MRLGLEHVKLSQEQGPNFAIVVATGSQRCEGNLTAGIDGIANLPSLSYRQTRLQVKVRSRCVRADGTERWRWPRIGGQMVGFKASARA